MATNFSFVADAAKRHAHELTPCCFGNRLAKRGLANARRADKAQDRAGQFIGTLLHCQIFDNAFFYLFKAVMIGIEHCLRCGQILLDF